MSSIGKEYDLGVKTLLYNKFKTILGAEDLAQKYVVVQAPVGIALREMAEHRQENFLDFISVYRSSFGPSWSRQRTPLARRGVWLSKELNVKALPIDINYDVYFWSKDVDKLYEAIEHYLFWQHEYPKITLTYLNQYEITPDLHFGDIIDEGTYEEKYDIGSIFRFRMPIKVDGWILKSDITTTGVVEKIRLTVYDKNELNTTSEYESIVVEDSGQDTELETALRFFRRHLYNISSIDLTNNYVLISGNWVSDFTVGDKLIIQGSTDNNGLYTLLVVELVGDYTKIILEEPLSSTTADGVIYKAD